MEVVHADGIEGARTARGVAVVIDVLRAFTVSAYALAGGATRCLLVATVDQARHAAARDPAALVSAEVDGLPVPGIPISNSPTAITQQDLHGRTLIQRSTSGVQAALAAGGADHLLAAALVNARATARAVERLDAGQVTLISTGAPLGHPEDRICAELIAAYLSNQPVTDLDRRLQPIRRDPRHARSLANRWPGCPPADMELSLAVDRFDFAMAIQLRPGRGAAALDCATLYRR